MNNLSCNNNVVATLSRDNHWSGSDIGSVSNDSSLTSTSVSSGRNGEGVSDRRGLNDGGVAVSSLKSLGTSWGNDLNGRNSSNKRKVFKDRCSHIGDHIVKLRRTVDSVHNRSWDHGCSNK